MSTQVKIACGVTFIVGCLLGGLGTRNWMEDSWIPPRIAESYKVEMRELRGVIDGRCRTAIKDLVVCEVERDNLLDAVKEKCNNVIKYAVMLELENNWLNKVIDQCKCDRSKVPRD
jgi:DNA-binding protein Fis